MFLTFSEIFIESPVVVPSFQNYLNISIGRVVLIKWNEETKINIFSEHQWGNNVNHLMNMHFTGSWFITFHLYHFGSGRMFCNLVSYIIQDFAERRASHNCLNKIHNIKKIKRCFKGAQAQHRTISINALWKTTRTTNFEKGSKFHQESLC